jgi:hypothetical protein
VNKIITGNFPSFFISLAISVAFSLSPQRASNAASCKNSTSFMKLFAFHSCEILRLPSRLSDLSSSRSEKFNCTPALSAARVVFLSLSLCKLRETSLVNPKIIRQRILSPRMFFSLSNFEFAEGFFGEEKKREN